MTTYRVVFTTETSCRLVADEGTGEAITFTSLAHAQAFRDGLNATLSCGQMIAPCGYAVQEMVDHRHQNLWAVTGGYQSPDFRDGFYYHLDCNGLDAPVYSPAGSTAVSEYAGRRAPCGQLCVLRAGL